MSRDEVFSRPRDEDTTQNSWQQAPISSSISSHHDANEDRESTISAGEAYPYSFSHAYDPYGQRYGSNHAMNRSYQNISTLGQQQPIMSTGPFNTSTPFPTSFASAAVANYAGQYPQYASYANMNNTMPYMSSARSMNPLNAASMGMGMGGQPGMNVALQEWFVKYQQWWSYMNHQRQIAMRGSQSGGERARMTPHRFPHRHARVAFGSTNQLLVIYGTSVTIQQLDPALIDLGESALVSSWPGPLIKNQTDKADVLEYVRAQESVLKRSEQLPEEYMRAHQKKQIWLVLSMLVRQNGVISGADLSELLLSNNEREFESDDESTDLGKLRRYLMLGQRKIALEHSTKSALWGHAFALTHLTSSSTGSNAPQAAPQMSAMISKFINTTLSRQDPIFVLLRCLLQRQQSDASGKNNAAKSVAASNLQQFAMLLANDCDVSPVISDSVQSKELLKFIVALRSNQSQMLVNLANLAAEAFDGDDKKQQQKFAYSDELVFVNEIWEFARDVSEFIEALVPLKLIFATRLFDYGLLDPAAKYCYFLRQCYTYYDYYFPGRTHADSTLAWDAIMQIVNDIESRIYQFDVTKGKSKDEAEARVKSEQEEAARRAAADADKRQESPSNQDSDDVDEESDDDDDDDDEDNSAEIEAIAPPPTKVSEAAKITRQSVPSQRSTAGQSIRPSASNQHGVAASSSGKPIVSNAQAVGSSAPTANVSNSNDNRAARVRTISKERTLTASDKTSDSGLKQTFQQSSASNAINQKQTSAAASKPQQPLQAPLANSAGPQLFVPAPLPTAESSSFDFVSSTAAPALTSSNVAGDLVSEDDTTDGRLSAPPPRDDKQYQFNSTTMPTAAAGFNGGFNQRNSAGGFAPPFSPIASHDPELSQKHQYNQNSGEHSSSVNPMQNSSGSQQQPPPQQTNNTSRNANGEQSGKANNQSEKSEGFLASLFKKVVPAGPKQAILPDDKNPSIVYDENLKCWVNKEEPEQANSMDAIRQGPPKMPLGANMSANTAASHAHTQPPPLGTQQGASFSPPPPTMSAGPPGVLPLPSNNLPVANGNNSFNYVNKGAGARKKPQYVDLWQQQQQQQQKATS